MPSAITKSEPAVLIKKPTTVRFPDPKQTDHELAAGQLTAFHIDRVISFEYTTDKGAHIYHKVRGIMREANHDGNGSEIWLTGFECDSGDKDPFTLDHHHQITLEGS